MFAQISKLPDGRLVNEVQAGGRRTNGAVVMSSDIGSEREVLQVCRQKPADSLFNQLSVCEDARQFGLPLIKTDGAFARHFPVKLSIQHRLPSRAEPVFFPVWICAPAMRFNEQ